MTKKRKRYPDLNQKLERPWCFYCERDFDDLKILISHQKAKHFKCDRCGRRLNTAGGLSVHMNQVHKENLTHVENAIAGRQGLDIEIFGMEGVPGEIVDQHNQHVTQKHFAEEEERARVTGNPVRGAANGVVAQKRKRVSESLEEIEGRVVRWREDRKNGVLPVQMVQPAVVEQVVPVAAVPVVAQVGVGAGAGGGVLPARPGVSASVEELVASVAGEERREEKKSKKNANMRLIFFDESVSPEEKMAGLPRFAEWVRV